MFIPINTDAPIYYRPVGTIGLIVLNVVAFATANSSPELFLAGYLPYGSGLTPVQWVTSNFLHSGFGHLFGNMIFLWGFGLVVEGKLGWQRFVPIYLGIGIVQCIFEQLIYWNQDGGSLGASAIIFGLMVMSLLWAPRNDLTIFGIILIRPVVFEISILLFAGLKLAASAFYIAAWGDPSEILHLMGGAVGAVVGVTMLKKNWVDCEGWDLFSQMGSRRPGVEAASDAFQADARRRQSKRVIKKKPKSVPSVQAPQEPRQSPEQKFSEMVAHQKPHAALREFRSLRERRPEWTPQPQELLSLAQLLRKDRFWDECLEAYWALLQVRPQADAVRLEVAEILVLVKESPTAARKLLSDCRREKLSPRQLERLDKLSRRIDRLIDIGTLEIESQWSRPPA